MSINVRNLYKILQNQQLQLEAKYQTSFHAQIEPCCRCEWFHSPIHEPITDGSRPSSPNPSQSPAKHLKAGPRLARKDGLQNGLRIGFKKPVMRIGSAEELVEKYPENQVDMRSYGMKEGYSHG